MSPSGLVVIYAQRWATHALELGTRISSPPHPCTPTYIFSWLNPGVTASQPGNLAVYQERNMNGGEVEERKT